MIRCLRCRGGFKTPNEYFDHRFQRKCWAKKMGGDVA